MSHDETEQTSDDGRNSFPVVFHRLLTTVSKKSPHLMGWGDRGTTFYMVCSGNEEEMQKAITPFFAHGNFASMRRQLSSYRFSRGKNGHWYHPRFHKKSTPEDLFFIQGNRRKRGEFREQLQQSKKQLPKLPNARTGKTSMLRNMMKGTGPLANVDINANNAHETHKQERAFPEKLGEMLDNLSPKYPRLLGWSRDGKAFFVDRRLFEDHSWEVKEFFPRGNLRNFQRQLNACGFRRHPSGTLEGYWYHQYFSSKQASLPSSGSDAPSFESADIESDSDVGIDAQPVFLGSTCPLTTVVDEMHAADITKRNILGAFYCESCFYMEGKVCCDKCPGLHHRNCHTSRCVSHVQHADFMYLTT
ncbi:hypothetical protein FisN_11Lu088 [Fistulifera solaris]|uniref:HSF-type DNA-binding domain-containing protein n=1 Tax=Fistulifera solaris TaxID=1519565 RepID=A0A1Z5J7I8_FISSO|nr:hypothetical protein FisN_11Lu088 [Fistulifera solaris]|eukprot:GAX09953.1 hypothetical protein FisN_11Lu088 [Fistulifera solaris]